MIDKLNAISPLDGRYASRLGTYQPIVSEFGLMRFRTMVEVYWLIHLSKNDLIPELPTFSAQAIEPLQDIYEKFSIEDAQTIKKIEQSTHHDVKAVEYFVAQKLRTLGLEKAVSFVHFACTSEDINNVSHALMLKASCDQLLIDIENIYQQLKTFSHAHKNVAMLSRTHGQAASPTTLGKEIAVFAKRLYTQALLLKRVKIYGKFNGAVGNFNAHVAAYPQIDWVSVSQSFMASLKLYPQLLTTQIEPHDYMAEFGHACIRINSVLMDLSRDCWGYISLNYFTQKLKANEVGSSTMPHKVNPIDFENAEGNLGLSNAVFSHLSEKLPISRYQRDLSDSTAIRNMGTATGYMALGFFGLKKGLNKLEINQKAIEKDLSGAWMLLAEPIQTVMRKHGIADAYEKLKHLTRGHTIDQQTIATFVEGLSIPNADKKQLQALTPSTYIGIAPDLVGELPASII